MSTYRRAKSPGGTFFFTVVTDGRQPVLCDPPVRSALRNAIEYVRRARPFTIDAWVLLPDHLHCIWTLPEGDDDFSQRWAQIKREVSRTVDQRYRHEESSTLSKLKHRDATIWQRRFWEHCIRDEEDLRRHLDYLHFNPVKHELVQRVGDWPFSTFHRYRGVGMYPADWVGDDNIDDIPEP